VAKVIKLVIFLFVIVLSGCGTQGSSGSSSTDTPDPGETETAVVSAILLSTTTATIGTGESATISARLLDSSGQTVTGSKTVTFSLSAPSLASINSPATTGSGLLTRTLVANNIEGSLIVTASVDSATATLAIDISDELSAATINVTSNPANITVGGTSVVSAEVLDSNGDPMAAGTNVNFEVNNDSLGSIVSSASISGSSGIAKATFSAGTTSSGTVTVTATSGTVSGSTTIDVGDATAGSIEFYSADPQIVVLKGAGGIETSTVTFLVKDSSGNPLAGSQTVTMKLSGPNGDEYIDTDDSPDTLDVGTVNGYATVVLHSGSIPGTATITATVSGTDPVLSTSSGVIAIGGGVPSAGHFSIATTRKNLEGLAYNNVTADISVSIADRYGNYNVLEGTSVSFYSECGAIDRAVNLDAEGQGFVVFRTQLPRPEVVPMTIEDQKIVDAYNEKLGVVIPSYLNPRNGQCTIVAVSDGEEEFTDSNGNGVYDSDYGSTGEPFSDTYDDIHLDKDDDPLNLKPSEVGPDYPFDPSFEDLIVDRDKDGVFDGLNGKWDPNKRIATQIQLMITGNPDMIDVAIDGFPIHNYDNITIGNGQSKTIYFYIHDNFYNQPVAGSTFTVSCDVGTLTGKTTWTYADTATTGPIPFSIKLSDKDTDADLSSGTLEISWTSLGLTRSFTAYVDIL